MKPFELNGFNHCNLIMVFYNSERKPRVDYVEVKAAETFHTSIILEMQGMQKKAYLGIIVICIRLIIMCHYLFYPILQNCTNPNHNKRDTVD